VVLTVAGGGGGGNGQNVGRGFISMTDWDDRAGDQNTAEAITNRATKAMSGFRDLEFYALQPPIVRGLGQATGFQAELQNTGGLSREEFAKVRDQVLADCRADKRLANVRLTNLPDQPTLKISTDTQKLQALGITAANVNNTLDRLGRHLCQRFRRPRPCEARLCDGRRTVPLASGRPQRLACARRRRADGAFLHLRLGELGQGADLAAALQRHLEL
jgi:hypothetical protein